MNFERFIRSKCTSSYAEPGPRSTKLFRRAVFNNELGSVYKQNLTGDSGTRI